MEKRGKIKGIPGCESARKFVDLEGILCYDAHKFELDAVTQYNEALHSSIPEDFQWESQHNKTTRRGTKSSFSGGIF